jgi:hypothetical protein
MPRIAVTLLFLALLGAAVVLSRANGGTAAGSGDTTGALARYGFRLEEVSRAAGLEFTHQAPTLDPKLSHIMPQIASMGAGVSVSDFDRDGFADIYVTNSAEGSKNRLYRNRGGDPARLAGNGSSPAAWGSSFTDVAETLGVADVQNGPERGVAMGAVWGDYDNDGFEDLLVYKWGRPELFHNEGGKRFTRVTEGAGLPAWVNANSALWLDYDRDGRLDLLIAGYYDERINLWRLQNTRMMPESFEYARNGGRKYLLRNLGEGRFQDVTEATGLRSRRWALAAAAADLRGTGYPDLVIANDYGVSEYFANEGGKRFREIGKQTGIGEAPKSGMNVAFGDILNQGREAIYITNISEEGVLIQGNNLWVPRDGASGSEPRYDNMAEALGVERGGWSFGAQFGDLNNDGWLDLFLTNGYVSANKSRSYWYNFAKVAGGNTAIISDAKNWPAMEDMSLSGYQQKRVWINDGAGRFVDVAPHVGVTETHDGRAVALADFGNRGALDVVIAHQKGPLLLYRNHVTPENAWIAFELEGSRSDGSARPDGGTKSNRSAIGATVRVAWNGQEQVQHVLGGSGFCAQNQRRLHFGLGKDAKVEKVVIRWPSGKEQTLPSPEVGKLHRVKEPA